MALLHLHLIERVSSTREKRLPYAHNRPVLRRLLDLDVALRAALALDALLAATAIAAWIVVALAHLDDGYHVDHVAGAWMALTEYADRGTLYPPLYEGELFGGTRYMPLPIVLNAAVAKATGEYLVSGKLVAMLVVAAVLVLVWHTARRLGAPGAIALACGWRGDRDLHRFLCRHDDLRRRASAPAAAGSGRLVLRTTVPRAVVAAGVLAALAPAAKLSAFWGGAAVVVWLLLRDRRRVALFASAAAATAAAVLGVAELASRGRLTENIQELA